MRPRQFLLDPVGTEKFEARATEVFGAERDRLFAEAAKLMPLFADYQTKTRRQIPLLILTRIAQGK
jgi:F420H(2)-dependent quinone reductase